MSFVKLDTGILDSSLWLDKAQRDTFITALLMAVPHQVKEPTRALNVRDLNESGFVVPPGDYGLVAAAGPGICQKALIDLQPGLDALERLGQPDPFSRTPDHDGRRLVRIAGGFIVLNYDQYRQKDHTGAERQRRYRERQRNGVTPSDGDDGDGVTGSDERREVTSQGRHVTQAEAEAEKRQKKEPADSGNARNALWTRPHPGVDAAVWKDWCEVRKRKKAAMSERAYNDAISNLDAWSREGHKPNDVVKRSADSGWTGLFKPKPDTHPSTAPRYVPGIQRRPTDL